MEVQARTAKHPTPVKVNYNIPADLDGKRKLFGDEVVNAAAGGAIVISLQAFMRRHIEKGTAQPAIQQAVGAWKPDVRSIVKQTAFEKVSSNISKLTPEERKKLLAELQKS